MVGPPVQKLAALVDIKEYQAVFCVAFTFLPPDAVSEKNVFSQSRRERGEEAFFITGRERRVLAS